MGKDKVVADTDVDVTTVVDTTKGKVYDEAHVHKLNEENKARRLENETLSQRLTEAETKIEDVTTAQEARNKDFLKALGVDDKSDVDANEVTLARIKELEDKINTSDARTHKAEQERDKEKIFNMFSTEAQKAGMSPTMVEDAFRLSDLSKVKVNPETQSVEGVSEALVNLKEKKSYLFTKVAPKDVGGGGEPSKEEDEKVFSSDIRLVASEMGITPEAATELFEKREKSKKERAEGKETILGRITKTPRYAKAIIKNTE